MYVILIISPTSHVLINSGFFLDNNATLARNQYIIDSELFDQKVWELVLQYNYTLNPQGVYEAIKYMYTYWPDPRNITHIRDQYINVSCMQCKLYAVAFS